jgi:hypothetical protein
MGCGTSSGDLTVTSRRFVKLHRLAETYNDMVGARSYAHNPRLTHTVEEPYRTTSRSATDELTNRTAEPEIRADVALE